jgi:hypothetical protein
MKRTAIFVIGLTLALTATVASARETWEEIQAPRGQEIQAPRGADVEIQSSRA